MSLSLRLKRAWNALTFPFWNTSGAGGVSGRIQVPGISRPAENVLMVFAALKARCDAIKQVPLRLSDAGDNFIEGGDLYDLLAKPNQFQDGVAYIESIEGYLSLYDEVLIAKVAAGTDSLPDELVPLNPMHLRQIDAVHLPTGLRIPAGWDYTDPMTGSMVRFFPDQVIWICGFNPHAPLRGLGPEKAARRSMQSDIVSREHNLAIFANGGSPDFVLETDQRWSPAQVEEFQDSWQKRHGGFENAHKAGVLYGGLKINKMGLSNTELQFLEGLRMTTSELLCAMRVYPAMVGLMTGETGLSQGSSTNEQKVAWWTDVGRPELARIASAHQEHLVDKYAWSGRAGQSAPSRTMKRYIVSESRRQVNRNSARKLYVWFDVNQVDALVDHRRKGIDQFDKLLNRGYRPDDINDYLDLGLPAHTTNIATVPIGVQPATDLALLAAEPVKPAEVPDPRSSALDLLEQIECKLRSSDNVPSKYKSLRKGLDRFIAQRERACAKKYSRFFLEQRDRVLERMKGRSATGSTRMSPEQLLPLSVENEELLKRMSGLWMEFIVDGWNTVNEEVGLGKEVNAFSESDPSIVDALAKRKIQGFKVNETTEEDLRKMLDQSISEGWTENELADSIADYYSQNCIGLDKVRPQTAARTQTAGIVNDGRMASARSAGNLRKGWLHGGSSEPRPAHLAAQAKYLNEPIGLDEKFDIGGVEMDAPGDTSAPIGEVANCTCMVVFSQT